jgi:uncharacterized membrane protein YccC
MKSIAEKLIHEANLESLGFRRALRSAIIAFISVVLYHHFTLMQGYWVTLTAVIVVQSTVGATLRKGIQRFLGTLLGVSIATLFLIYTHHRFLIDIYAIIFLFLAYFFNPYTNLINYGFVVVPVSITVVFLLALINPEKMSLSIVYARFYDTLIGATLGILGALFLFPNKVKGEFDSSKEYLKRELADYFFAILDMFLNNPKADAHAKAKKMLVEEALLSDRQFYLERRYEIHFRFSQHEIEKQFLEISERMAQRLFSLHHRARFHLSSELIEKMREIILTLQKEGFSFLSEEITSADQLENILKTMQKQLAEMAKKQDNVENQHWQDIAPLASLHFAIIGLIQDMKQVRDEH